MKELFDYIDNCKDIMVHRYVAYSSTPIDPGDRIWLDVKIGKIRFIYKDVYSYAHGKTVSYSLNDEPLSEETGSSIMEYIKTRISQDNRKKELEADMKIIMKELKLDDNFFEKK